MCSRSSVVLTTCSAGVGALLAALEDMTGCGGRSCCICMECVALLLMVCGVERSIRDREKVAVVGVRVSESEDATCSLVL